MELEKIVYYLFSNEFRLDFFFFFVKCEVEF